MLGEKARISLCLEQCEWKKGEDKVRGGDMEASWLGSCRYGKDLDFDSSRDVKE